MDRRAFRAIVLALIPVAMAGGASAAPVDSFGVWRNPGGSVHIRAERCGQAMCGTVVWASDKAKADARRGGTDPLIGTQLFRDFRPQKRNVWLGRVFVPDIGKTFSGTVRLIDPDHLEGKGCLIGGIGCRSQVWTRLP